MAIKSRDSEQFNEQNANMEPNEAQDERSGDMYRTNSLNGIIKRCLLMILTYLIIRFMIVHWFVPKLET